MSFSIGNNYCDKCGKPLSIFEQGLCAECEKKALLDEPNTVVGCIPTIEAYRQVCKERDIAIEQLHELGYELGKKIEPCGNAVDRQAVFDQMYEWMNTCEYRKVNATDYFVNRINKLPSVRPQEQTGHWITEDMFDGDVAYRCSECNELFWLESGTPKENEYNFCPKCGKKLVEPQESEDKE